MRYITKMFESISNLKVGARVGLLAVLALLGVTALAGTVFIADSMSEAAREKQAKYTKLAMLNYQVGMGVLQMRRREKDFLLRMDPKYIDAYLTDEKRVVSLLTDISKMDMGKDVLSNAASLIEGMGNHAKQFAIVADTYKEIGLTEKQGLRGQLRNAVHDVETKLKEAGLDNLAVKMLMMRRHEKDYMLRGDDKYIGRIDKRHAEFKELLEDAPVSEAYKIAILTFMQKYVDGIHSYAAAVKKAEAATHTLSEIFEDMVPAFTALQKLSQTQQKEASAEAQKITAAAKTTITVASIAVLVILLFGSFVIGRGISRPITAMTGVMGILAKGNTDIDIPFQNKRDEIGDMAKAVQVFKDNSIEQARLEKEAEQSREQEAKRVREEQEREAERAEAERKREQEERDREKAEADAREERAQRVATLIATFESKIQSLIGTLVEESAQMKTSADAMAAVADEANDLSTTVASASEEATSNVQTVATATEELSCSIQDISQQISRANGVSQNAVEEAQSSTVQVAKLAEMAKNIGEVVDLINDIASQTNLLALNATIEAARAGEAGKGFAVVASEVKSLATQTAKATDEIGQQISGMQSATDNAVVAISNIDKVIQQMNEITTGISAAVEQQSAATSEISRNIQQASVGTEEVSQNIVRVSDGANKTGESAQQVLGGIHELDKVAADLRSEINQFLGDVRTA